MIVRDLVNYRTEDTNESINIVHITPYLKMLHADRDEPGRMAALHADNAFLVLLALCGST